MPERERELTLELEHVFNERYRVDARLGTGGMAVVYCGTDLLLRRRVAIKVLRDQFASDDDFVKRFSYEAQSAAKLSHPNIVNIYDFGREDDAYFIVMELVEGETLAELLRGERAIPEAVAIDYATQIAAGLAYAHRQGLLHRDVKPANILITKDDVVKLSDFGIARAVAENAVGVTQPGMVMGSVAYISPEQAQGHELDARSDLYSLGVVLYQMVTGRLPFNGENPVAVALKHVSEPAPRIDPARAGISPALASIIDRLLSKDPAGRLDSAAELGRSLREAREQPAVVHGGGRSHTDAAASGSGGPRAPQPPPRRSAAPDRTNGSATVVTDPPVREFDGPRMALIALAFIIALAAGYFVVQSLGPRRDIPVGDYTNESMTQAQQAIAAAGLAPQVQYEASETVAPDRIIRQDPAPGGMRARSEAVTLFVSSGMPLVAVPDVKGFTRADAEHALSNAKFKATVALRYANEPKDTVLALNPGAGTQAREGSTVVLSVSQGQPPVRVPQLVGLSLEAARSLLDRLGLKLNVDQQTASDVIPKDTIASQGAAADSTVARGSTLGVTVSTGAVLVTVPDVTGRTPGEAAAMLSSAGFSSRIAYIVDATNASGSVSAQDPLPNSTAPRNSAVTINVAVPGTVPDVAGNSLDGAKQAIIANGYTVGNVALTQDGDEGKVVRTEPEANATLRPGEAVTIYYHAAPAK